MQTIEEAPAVEDGLAVARGTSTHRDSGPSTQRTGLSPLTQRAGLSPSTQRRASLGPSTQRAGLGPSTQRAGPSGDSAGQGATLGDSATTSDIDLGPVQQEPAEVSDGRESALTLIDRMLQPTSAASGFSRAVVVKVGSSTEHDMLLSQMQYVLASKLRDTTSGDNVSRLVPIVLPMARVTEALQDETRKATPREMIAKAFEADYPSSVDVLRQAMELRDLVIVAEVHAESDLLGFKDAMLDELLANRLIVLSGLAPSVQLPSGLLAGCSISEVCALGLFYNDVKLAGRLAKDLLRQLRSATDSSAGPSHFSLVSALHLSASDLSLEAVGELDGLLSAEACRLRLLDVSFAQLDAKTLLKALSRSHSLTSLDVRMVPGCDVIYEPLGMALLQATGKCQLRFCRCDVFELVEADTKLNLSERSLGKDALYLLIGLLKRNSVVQDLDLSATDLEKDWASLLVRVLAFNTSLSALHLAHNPALDEEWKRDVESAAKQSNPGLVLHF